MPKEPPPQTPLAWLLAKLEDLELGVLVREYQERQRAYQALLRAKNRKERQARWEKRTS